MPWALILVVAGLVLVFATSYVTLGYVLIAIGVGLTLLTVLFFSAVFRQVNKGFKSFDRF